MRLLVCGGRDYSDEESLYRALNILNPSFIIHGDCSGADKLAGRWANMNLVQQAACTVTQADYDRHGKAAPVIRNQEMLERWKPNMVLATPGGRGTDDMIRRALKMEVPVVRLVS